jgi:cyclic beta-1,2-glucan synthetase
VRLSRVRRPTGPPPAQSPHRGPLLSAEALEGRARALAARFTLARRTRSGARRFRSRFNEHCRVIRQAYRAVARTSTAAAHDRPRRRMAARQLPISSKASGSRSAANCRGPTTSSSQACLREFEGAARIYVMAPRAHFGHSDGHLDLTACVRFVTSYQTLAPLTIGELWAWPACSASRSWRNSAA